MSGPYSHRRIHTISAVPLFDPAVDSQKFL